MQETGSILGWEDPLEEAMAIRPSILAWRIPWTEQPVGYSPWGQKESDMTEQLTRGGGKKMWLHNLADTFFFMESRARASLFPNSNLKNNSCFPG